MCERGRPSSGTDNATTGSRKCTAEQHPPPHPPHVGLLELGHPCVDRPLNTRAPTWMNEVSDITTSRDEILRGGLASDASTNRNAFPSLVEGSGASPTVARAAWVKRRFSLRVCPPTITFPPSARKFRFGIGRPFSSSVTVRLRGAVCKSKTRQCSSLIPLTFTTDVLISICRYCYRKIPYWYGRR